MRKTNQRLPRILMNRLCFPSCSFVSSVVSVLLAPAFPCDLFPMPRAPLSDSLTLPDYRTSIHLTLNNSRPASSIAAATYLSRRLAPHVRTFVPDSTATEEGDPEPGV